MVLCTYSTTYPKSIYRAVVNISRCYKGRCRHPYDLLVANCTSKWALSIFGLLTFSSCVLMPFCCWPLSWIDWVQLVGSCLFALSSDGFPNGTHGESEVIAALPVRYSLLMLILVEGCIKLNTSDTSRPLLAGVEVAPSSLVGCPAGLWQVSASTGFYPVLPPRRDSARCATGRTSLSRPGTGERFGGCFREANLN